MQAPHDHGQSVGGQRESACAEEGAGREGEGLKRARARKGGRQGGGRDGVREGGSEGGMGSTLRESWHHIREEVYELVLILAEAACEWHRRSSTQISPGIAWY